VVLPARMADGDRPWGKTRRGHPDRASAWFRRALAIQPDHRDAQRNLAPIDAAEERDPAGRTKIIFVPTKRRVVGAGWSVRRRCGLIDPGAEVLENGWGRGALRL
jgi:hypothetical protein